MEQIKTVRSNAVDFHFLLKKQREFYNRVGEGDKTLVQIDGSDKSEHKRYELLHLFIERYANNRVPLLEVGCGFGVDKTLQQTPRYVGVDLSSSMLKAGNVKNPFCADVHNMPFKDGCFGIVLSVAAFEHFVDPEKALQEMMRVLEPGGYFILSAAWLCGIPRSPWFKIRTIMNRLMREVRWWLAFKMAPRLEFQRLLPHLETYTHTDSDAIISIDIHSVLCWLRRHRFILLSMPTLMHRIMARGAIVAQKTSRGK